jgi:hypothetical protein
MYEYMYEYMYGLVQRPPLMLVFSLNKKWPSDLSLMPRTTHILNHYLKVQLSFHWHLWLNFSACSLCSVFFRDFSLFPLKTSLSCYFSKFSLYLKLIFIKVHIKTKFFSICERLFVCVYCGAYHPAIQPSLSVCCPMVPFPSPASVVGCFAILPRLFLCAARCIPWPHRAWFENIPWINFGPAGITALTHHLTIVYVYPCYTFLRWWWCTAQITGNKLSYVLCLMSI